MITREQVADLRPGDIVNVTSARWAEGTELGGPLWDDAGVLRCGPISVRYPDGHTAQNPDWQLTLVRRAPRALYLNHPRTAPYLGDIVRDADGDAYRYWSNGWCIADKTTANPMSDITRYGPLTLLWDGETGEVVR